MRRRDVAWRLAVALLISVGAWVPVVEGQSPVDRALDVGLGVLAFALVLLRRRRPFAVAVVTTLLTTFSSLATGPSILAIVSLATGGAWAQIVVAGALSVLCGELHIRLYPTVQTDPGWLTLAAGVVFTSATLAWGMYIGSRRELLWTLRRRAEVAEAERDLRASQSRIEERSRIAREMHDVLAHRISQISVRAGALNYRTDLTRDEMRDSAGVIRESAHEALTDLRGVLGVLRGDSGELQHAPQPTYVDLADLVEDARRSGMRIAYADTVDAPVPDATGRTVYRIVQEGVTNSRKHAPGAGLDIDLGGTPQEGITVVLRNALGFGRSSTPGSGLGLVGLTERAQLRGGRLEHGVCGDEFVLRAWMPWGP
nr:histidine kinase [Nocardioides lijunqiniae]